VGSDNDIVPVAILGHHALDVTRLDIGSIRLQDLAPHSWSYGDIATPHDEFDIDVCECGTLLPDGHDDLTLGFLLGDLVAALSRPVHYGEFVLLTITGERDDGKPIVGWDRLQFAADPAGDGDADDPRVELENYPNPFNPVTQIRFTLPEATWVRLDIFNVLGQSVTTLVNRRLDAGEHMAPWDGCRAASGVYFYRLQAGSFTATRKMILMR
jgi:hypothetical protein